MEFYDYFFTQSLTNTSMGKKKNWHTAVIFIPNTLIDSKICYKSYFNS